MKRHEVEVFDYVETNPDVELWAAVCRHRRTCTWSSSSHRSELSARVAGQRHGVIL